METEATTCPRARRSCQLHHKCGGLKWPRTYSPESLCKLNLLLLHGEKQPVPMSPLTCWGSYSVAGHPESHSVLLPASYISPASNAGPNPHPGSWPGLPVTNSSVSGWSCRNGDEDGCSLPSTVTQAVFLQCHISLATSRTRMGPKEPSAQQDLSPGLMLCLSYHLDV